MNLVPYIRSHQKDESVFTVTSLLEGVECEGNLLRCTVGSRYGGVRKDRMVDQVVVNHGTILLDDCTSN